MMVKCAVFVCLSMDLTAKLQWAYILGASRIMHVSAAPQHGSEPMRPDAGEILKT